MTEDKLNTLKSLPLPPPREGAKAAAFAAALAAFDAGTPATKTSEPTQGNESASRPIHASHANRRRMMRRPVLYRVAAGMAAFLVATPAALYVMNAYAPIQVAGIQIKHEEIRSMPRAYSDTPAPKTESPAAGRASDAGTARSMARVLSELKEPKAADPAPPANVRVFRSSPNTASPSEIPGDEEPVRAAPRPYTGAAKPLGGYGETRLGNTLEKDQQAAAPPSDYEASRAPDWDAAADKTLSRGYAASQPVPEAGARSSLTGPRRELLPPVAEALERRDQFAAPALNPIKQVAADPVSTFSIDVDTASYAFVRRALNTGRLPPREAVRVEEMINYFPYDYPRPETAETPFRPTITVTPAPWRPANKLVHIAIKGFDITPAQRPRANLVFLIDVSGSMHPADRLPLIKTAFQALLGELRSDDTVAIVTYASGSGVALEPTKVADKAKIRDAIEALEAGGSTAGAAGIADAYRLAEAHFDKDGVNRIILATDGDFNVGISDPAELKAFIERKRAAGIFLSILGVGLGNYNDALMQTLAQNGNGTAAYVDTIVEARKVLVEEASSTLFPIAKDVKIQVEFNPAAISEYRLIGYESRALAREDFNNDRVDAGEIGSGHAVTAIYEVTPVHAAKLVDDLRYGQPPAPRPAAVTSGSDEFGFLKLRYKLPGEATSRLISLPITPALEKTDIAAAPEDVRFSLAVAAFGQLLRGEPWLQGYGYDEVLALARGARGTDESGYRAEFLKLVRLANAARP